MSGTSSHVFDIRRCGLAVYDTLSLGGRLGFKSRRRLSKRVYMFYTPALNILTVQNSH